jgi:hypothetical protein
MSPVCLVLLIPCILHGLNLAHHSCSIPRSFHECNPVELHKKLCEIRPNAETQLIHSHTLPIREFRINGCIVYCRVREGWISSCVCFVGPVWRQKWLTVLITWFIIIAKWCTSCAACSWLPCVSVYCLCKHAAVLVICFDICLEPYVNRCTAHKHCLLLCGTSSDGFGKQVNVSVPFTDYFLFP